VTIYLAHQTHTPLWWFEDMEPDLLLTYYRRARQMFEPQKTRNR